MGITMYEMSIYFVGIMGLIAGAMLLWRILYCLDSGSDTITLEAVSIIIPARNEAAKLPEILGSIKSQKDFAGEVIVVDDHSTDETAALARSFGAIVIPSPPLPSGWAGKTWACFQGAKYASGDVLVFLDADTFIHPGGLRRMLTTFNHEPGVVSIAPFHVTKKIHEQFSAIFNIIVVSSVDAFSIFGSHRKASGLFGPCLIVSREDYTHINGHESVKGRILENLFMAEKFKAQGVEMACYGGKGVLSYRMYPDDIRQVIQGWGKAFVSGAQQTKRFITLLISFWFMGSVTVSVLTGIGLFFFDGLSMEVIFLLYLFFAVEHYWMLKRIGSFYISTALFFPIMLCFFLLVFLNSLIKNSLGADVQWKGRTLNV